MQRRRIFFVTFVAALMLPALAVAVTTARVFKLRYRTVAEAVELVQPMLSIEGSLTMQPHESRLTIQDRDDIVEHIAAVLEIFDSAPGRYRIVVELLEASNSPVPPGNQVEVDERVRRMFRYTSFRRLGTTVLEGELGGDAGADLGAGYQIRFEARSAGVKQRSVETDQLIPPPGAAPGQRVDSRPGAPAAGSRPVALTGDGQDYRVQLQGLTLMRTTEESGGLQRQVEVLRGRVTLAQGQQVAMVAGASETSDRGLVLIVRAQPVAED